MERIEKHPKKINSYWESAKEPFPSAGCYLKRKKVGT
jgi:hypothetical protein